MLEVYTPLKKITICTSTDLCSAQPVLDNFEIKVEELLK